MDKNKQLNPIVYEDVIDLRAIIQTLWDRKWIIFGVALGITLIFALGYYFLFPSTYQADAYVSITEPAVRAELESSIIVSPIQPDTNALVKLAESDDIQQQVFDLMNIGVDEQSKIELKSALQGWSQIHLQGKAQDPQLVADLTNTWAEVIVSRFNELYGSGEQTITVLEAEVEKSREVWEKTQSDLEAYLPQSQMDSVEIQLEEQKNSLAQYLFKLTHNQILISDCEKLKAQWISLNPGAELSTGNVLSMIALQQRASGGISGTQFQIEGAGIYGEGYTVEQGLRDLDNLIVATTGQIDDNYVDINQVQEKIRVLRTTYEEEKYAVDKLTQDRDLARSAFTALTNQLEETQITYAQEELAVRLGASAVAPPEPSSLSTLVVTVLTFSLGILLTSVVVLAISWWAEK